MRQTQQTQKQALSQKLKKIKQRLDSRADNSSKSDLPSTLLRPDLHFRIRRTIDPKQEFLSDDNIQRILAIVGFDIQRAAHRCFLTCLNKARSARDSATASRYQQQIQKFERGQLIV